MSIIPERDAEQSVVSSTRLSHASSSILIDSHLIFVTISSVEDRVDLGEHDEDNGNIRLRSHPGVDGPVTVGTTCLPTIMDDMPEFAPAALMVARRRSRWWPRQPRRFLAVLVVIGLVFCGGVTVRLFIWPDLPPLPSTVDAIVELGGPESAGRDAVALRLAAEHRAPYLVQSTTEAEDGADDCLPTVAGVTILCFHPTPNTTRGEARAIGELAEQYGWTSIIIITTRDHAWRASLRVARCFDGAIYVSPSPLSIAGWIHGVPYQMLATVKAMTYERSC